MRVAHYRAIDAGVQLERTSLAWSRTALGLVVVGALAVRRGMDPDTSVLAYVVGGLLLAGSLAAHAYGASAYERRVADLRSDRGIVRTGPHRALSQLVWMAALGILIVLLTNS
jgi:uncharacterized membrane protein YidH (DUF202 family)